MLRRLHNKSVEVSEVKLGRKTSKRQRISQFFRSRKQKPEARNAAPEKVLTGSESESPQAAHDVTSPAEAPLEQPRSSDEKPTSVEEPKKAPEPNASPRPETPEIEKVETLSEAQLHVLFSGTPHFSVKTGSRRPAANVSYPWGGLESSKDTLDSVLPDQAAFTSATLHPLPTKARTSSEEKSRNHGYDVDVVEVPNMLSAQGIEPGSIGFSHFLELPRSDSLLVDLEGSQTSKEFLQGTKNKELMQSAPERIGIRAVDMGLIYDRLIEIHDLNEAFHESPGPMTVLNHQSPGELYANLFSKFLTPPGYDGTTGDPTGLRVQILTLMRILKLKGVWYDFSLVEWRIRLGQILWSDPEAVPAHEAHPLWTEREVLLLQITLACELLLRLDAVTSLDVGGQSSPGQMSAQEIRGFFGSKTRKLDWDLVLARRFLDNILVVKSSDHDVEPSKSRGFQSMRGTGEPPEIARPDIVLLPQHQTRQLQGLIKFGSAIQWPSTETIVQSLAQRLGARGLVQQGEPLPTPDGMFLDPVSPATISVYGTPLETPRPANHMLDGYFGHIGKPALTRDNSHSLRIPLSPTLSPQPDSPSSTLTGIGGWLSRSYLTGLTLPGEAISHFLISTLLENDIVAIANLGDSANLYGGFSYAGRSWWSKNSIVGRVFACIDGGVECMGWISFPRQPEGSTNQWHSIHSEQIPLDDRMSDTTRSAAVARASSIIPDGTIASINSEDLVLPRDSETLPTPTLIFRNWELTPLNPDLMDSDMMSGPLTESDIHTPSVTFASQDRTLHHTLTLAFDVQFVTSWPCTPPMSTPVPAPSMPHILKRSLTGTVSRTSSKRSGVTMPRRNSHGFEPLLSHPPDSTDIAPKRVYSADTDNDSMTTITKRQPMEVHPLHTSYKYKTVSVTEVLDPSFDIPFDMHSHTRSPTPTGLDKKNDTDATHDKTTVLVLDARGSSDLQLLARSWCAEKGFHAIVGRVGRTCLACCIREARALGIHVVIRV
ncbi:hypothetical protein HBH98_209300 [Parastagonospora nodorum]|nr:hypothetical protein HBH98_209300 [Parastagonospora nodorum]KAH4365991.1 hypothetical protein HBH97_168880 [Parastagonospora nodorum]KAH4392179.1 hypothetical protein HBH99_148380 [Parastagonospora nodorum]KAH4969356.1 hypothetical protein HBI78_047970 [Parastagonospora nodorum]KAH5064511.1 hypothetical protein HBH96_049150 [Parastagonospora nodorum]